ncbi:hypothetical protein Q4Q39_13800 [Flavivirga amylovorans]|uniref:Uncharacterized protein n=1 Tax=Flavivirga amylovorans TaxID=870486 RepID=A0ABT8X3Q7_9FLAO|nr:hypothetical protein [Flavivirga amylovorans]MDO5988482.1 hypothetical protein [Flavivirga amylovorans]
MIIVIMTSCLFCSCRPDGLSTYDDPIGLDITEKPIDPEEDPN